MWVNPFGKFRSALAFESKAMIRNTPLDTETQS